MTPAMKVESDIPTIGSLIFFHNVESDALVSELVRSFVGAFQAKQPDRGLFQLHPLKLNL